MSCQPSFAAVCTAALLWTGTLAAQPAAEVADSQPVNKERIDAALNLTQSEATKYSFLLSGEQPANPQLRKDPVLRWSNPAAGEIHGNVFLWTVNDRPAVVGSLFKWFSPHTHMSHEFHSLAEVPLVGRYGERQVWQTGRGGVSFAPVPDSPRPADTKTRRFLQMRELAKDFAATKTDREGNQQDLRLLPQPAYRYSAPKEGILDGGLFVFVQGTDPEVFLLLEARGTGDEVGWQFAVTRMNSVAFEVRHRDKPVWSVEVMPWSDVGGHAQTYTTFSFKMP